MEIATQSWRHHMQRAVGWVLFILISFALSPAAFFLVLMLWLVSLGHINLLDYTLAKIASLLEKFDSGSFEGV